MIESIHELMHRVHIGNKKKCVVLSVYFDDTDPNIDGIGYDENCNESGNLMRNSGTIHMIKSAMAFVVKHYKKYNFKKFQFKDTSVIHCAKDYQMPLNVYYIAKHGKTWYEMKLKAKPVNENDKYYEGIRTLKESFKKPIGDHMMIYDNLMQNISKSKKNAFYPVFKNCTTIKEFFKYLFEEYDCFVLKDWLSRYILNFIPNLMRMEWYIEHFTDFNVEIEILKEKPEDLFMIGGVSHIV